MNLKYKHIELRNTTKFKLKMKRRTRRKSRSRLILLLKRSQRKKILLAVNQLKVRKKKMK